MRSTVLLSCSLIQRHCVFRSSSIWQSTSASDLALSQLGPSSCANGFVHLFWTGWVEVVECVVVLVEEDIDVVGGLGAESWEGPDVFSGMSLVPGGGIIGLTRWVLAPEFPGMAVTCMHTVGSAWGLWVSNAVDGWLAVCWVFGVAGGSDSRQVVYTGLTLWVPHRSQLQPASSASLAAWTQQDLHLNSMHIVAPWTFPPDLLVQLAQHQSISPIVVSTGEGLIRWRGAFKISAGIGAPLSWAKICLIRFSASLYW